MRHQRESEPREVPGLVRKGTNGAEARRRGPDVRTVTRTTTVTNRLSAQEILDRLAKLNPQTSEESRNYVLRQVVYNLQLLASLGEEALPVIRMNEASAEPRFCEQPLAGIADERFRTVAGKGEMQATGV